MLNGGPISYASKKQAVVALSSTEPEYVALSLAAREARWFRLLMTELGLLLPNQQFAKIHIYESNKYADAIVSKSEQCRLESRVDQHYDEGVALQSRPTEEEREMQRTNPIPNPFHAEHSSSITLKGDNQSSIALANNPVLHTRTKHIDIQHHYIRDEVTSGKINLVYTPTELMLADGLTKPLSSVKFLNLIKEMRME